MGATYTRQSSAGIVDGGVIEASDLNDEFDQLVAALAVTTGHTHDGTTAEGGPVTKLLGNTLTFGAGTAGTDITVTFDGETSDGVMYWMEDEDHFKFADDIVVDSTKRLYFNDEGGEYIYGDGTDLYLTSGADINIPANIGMTFGNDGEKIEGDGTDLTITGNNIKLTATADVVIPADVGITFGTGEKIEGNSTDLTVTSGADINLTATSDVNIPSGVGVTFGDDGEKIEGDGTNLTIATSNNVTVDAAADIILDVGGADVTLKDDGTTFGSLTQSGGELLIKSGSTPTTAVTFSGANATVAGNLSIGGDLDVTGSFDMSDANITNIGSIALDTITNDGTDITLDSSGDIILDAAGDTIFLKDAGTTFGSLDNSSGNLIIKSGTTTAATFSGANVTLAGTVGSGAITSTGAVQGTTITATSAFAGTLSTAAQTNITSLGTLTALTVDDVAINGKVVTMTGSASDTVVLTAGTNGTLDITTTDAAAAAANIQITADGTVDIDSAGVLTLDSGAAINIEPASGSAILLDGTISIDAGVVTGATSITSTAFVGALTGNASGTAATVTGAAQSNITSLGTLTALTVDDVAIDGKVVTMTGSSSDTAVLTAGTNGTLSIVTTDAAAAAANITITADGTFEADGTTVTLDSAGDIVLDAGGADVTLKDDGTVYGSLTQSGGELIIKSGSTPTTAMTFSGANVTFAGTVTIGSAGISETELEILDGATVTTTELNLIDGVTSRGTTAVASGDGILINDDGTMRMTNVDTVSTYFASHNVGGGNIVTTGALDSGSITSGFGAIDNGTSGIRTNTFTAETSLVPDASGGADIGTTSLEWGDFYIADDKYIQFGSDQNVLVGYDETTTDSLKIAATEGAGLAITLMADEGDDAGDEWKLNVADGGTITLGNDIASAGTFVTHLTLTPHATITSSLANFAGEVQMVTLDIGGTNVSATAAELNYSDLATLGTSAASKVLSADSNNLTKITGGVYLEEDTLSFDATQDWDVRASPVAQVTLTANVTFDAPSNPTTGQYISILCIQDGTGSRTIAWNAVFEFTGGTAPTATTTAGKGDLFTFRYHNSHWIEVGRNLNLTRA